MNESHLASATKSKGGRPNKSKLSIGKVFGFLTVVDFVGMSPRKHSIVRCRCECGTFVEIQIRYISNAKRPPHCGCRFVKGNISHRRAWAAKWRASNPSKVSEYQKQDRKLHWAKRVQGKMAWKRANPDKVAAIAKKFREAHPERVQAGKAVYRARKLKATVGDPAIIMAWETVWKKKRRVPCYWCGGSFAPKSCHVDHIVALDKGGAHEVGNLCVSCASCNLRKNSLTVAAWNSHIAAPVLL